MALRPSDLSLSDLQSMAAPHHRRWVGAALILVVVGYALSLAAGIRSAPTGDWITDAGGLALGLISLYLLHRNRIIPAIVLTTGGVWTEIHLSILIVGGTASGGIPVLPVFVAGVALLFGPRAGYGAAGVTAVSASAAAITGARLHGIPVDAGVVAYLVVLTVALGSMAVLMGFGLRSFGAVLSDAREGRRLAEHALIERRALETQLIKAQKLEAVARLAGGVAHDFNNLLTAIGASAELMRDADAAESRELTAEILDAQERGAALTRQLLTFARRDVSHERTLSVAEIVGGIDGLMRRLAGERVTLTVTVDAPGWITADPSHVEQILLNLVTNARDAMPAGGTLQVHVGIEAGGVVLRVTDTGTGMDEATLASCREAFFTTKPVGIGTGLGLATIQSLVTQQGGILELASAVDAGTTVTVTWPPADATDEEPVDAIFPEAEFRRPGCRVLLVEDNAQTRRLLRRLLEHAQMEVVEAASAEEALAWLDGTANRLDLLLSDVVMPGAPGFAVADHVEARHPEAAILLMSGYTDEPGDPTPRQARYPVLAKPFRGEDLWRHLRALLA